MEKEDLPAVLAPLDLIDAEVAVFPKGHASVASSWSAPASGCSLETSDLSEYEVGAQFCVKSAMGKWRGPIRFHLELEKDRERAEFPDFVVHGGRRMGMN